MNNEITKVSNEVLENINPWAKIEVVKKCFAPTLSDDEFKIFVGLGKSLNANPFTREIWAVKYGTSAASIFCGRDFYRRKAQEQADYNGHIVNAVYENDEFSIINGNPEHKVNSFKDRGELVGAFCSVYRKCWDMPYFTMVKLSEYNKGQSNWKTMPETMIKKVAEAQALRGAFQGVFKGTYDESEQEVIKQNVLQEQSDIASVKQIDYAFNLLRTTAYDEYQKQQIEGQLSYGITTQELNGIILNLQMNQLSNKDSGYMSKKDINEELDRKLEE